MTTTDRLAQGRTSFTQRVWGDAYGQFATADADTPLDLDDLQQFALAAYLTGNDEVATRAWTRAHHEAIRRDDSQRAARHAILIGSGLMFRGEPRRRWDGSPAPGGCSKVATSAPNRAAQAVVPDFEGPPEDEPLLEFQVADPDVLRQRLVDAGLTDVNVDTSYRERITVRTGQQLWDWTIGSNPIPGMLVADLTDEQRGDIIQVLDGMVRERSAGNGPAVLTAPLNIGVGRK